MLLRSFFKIDWGLWSLWAKGRAVGNAQRFPRQAARCPQGIVHKLHSLYLGSAPLRSLFVPRARKPVNKHLARGGRCSSGARTVGGAKLAFMRKGVEEHG